MALTDNNAFTVQGNVMVGSQIFGHLLEMLLDQGMTHHQLILKSLQEYPYPNDNSNQSTKQEKHLSCSLHESMLFPVWLLQSRWLNMSFL